MVVSKRASRDLSSIVTAMAETQQKAKDFEGSEWEESVWTGDSGLLSISQSLNHNRAFIDHK